MSPRQPTDPKARQALGLDKPCTVCGQEIYYNYKGPFEGVCGRCTDKIVRKQRRTRTRTLLVERAPRRIGAAWLLVAFLAGAAAVLLLRPWLPF